MIKATVSGSFHRHMASIADAVASLIALGVNVLSPSDPRVVGADGEFLFVASDKLRSRRLVEDRHLEAIRASDFLWVVCPDGYTGASTSGEILAAAVLGKPIFSVNAALDVTIGDYVERVPTMAEAISRTALTRKTVAPAIPRIEHALLNPDVLAETAHELDDLYMHLRRERGNGSTDAERAWSRMKRKMTIHFGLNRFN